MLKFSRYTINLAVFFKPCSGLLEMKRHARLFTLCANVKHPIIVADAGFVSRLAAADNTLNLIRKIRRKDYF